MGGHGFQVVYDINGREAEEAKPLLARLFGVVVMVGGVAALRRAAFAHPRAHSLAACAASAAP